MPNKILGLLLLKFNMSMMDKVESVATNLIQIPNLSSNVGSVGADQDIIYMGRSVGDMHRGNTKCYYLFPCL